MARAALTVNVYPEAARDDLQVLHAPVAGILPHPRKDLLGIGHDSMVPNTAPWNNPGSLAQCAAICGSRSISANAVTTPIMPLSCFAYTIGGAVFDWDENNLRKIRADRIRPEEVEEALSNGPIPIYEQNVQGELRYVYYGETESGRLLAVVVIERDGKIRVVTAYDQMPGKRGNILPGGCKGNEAMKRTIAMPTFASEEAEANWWASREGREFVRQKSADALKQGSVAKGSRLVRRLNRPASVQIALRCPNPTSRKRESLRYERASATRPC